MNVRNAGALVCAMAMIIAPAAQAVNNTATSSGNWANYLIWDQSHIPAASEAVFISSGVTVTNSETSIPSIPSILVRGTLQLTDTNAIAAAASMTMTNGATLQLCSDTAAVFNTPLGTLTSSGAATHTINVDNNGSGADNTLTLNGGGKYVTLANGNSVQLNITGNNNGYVLRIPTLQLQSITTTGLFIINPTSASVNIGTISSAAPTGDANLYLRGTGTGNSLDNFLVTGTSYSQYIYKDTAATWTVGNAKWKSRSFVISAGKLIISPTGQLDTTSGSSTAGSESLQLTGGELDYNNAAAVKTGSGKILKITGGSLDNTSGAAITTSTTNPEMQWGGNFTFLGANGVNSDLNLGNGAVTLNANSTVTNQNADSTLTVNGSISGAFGLTKAGPGTLELGGANTFSGTALVNAGTLKLTNASGLSRAIVNTASAGVFSLVGPTTLTLGGLIGSANLGSGTIFSTGYSGVTALTLNNQSGISTYSGAIADGAAPMSLTKTGAGTQVLSGNNTYTGPTTLSAGELMVSTANNLGSGNLVFNGGTLGITNTTLTKLSDLGRTIVYNPGAAVGLDIANAANTFTVDQAITGAVSFVKVGAGTLVFSTNNSYSGSTTISGGVLQYNDGSTIPTTPLFNNASLVINRPDDLTQGSTFHSFMGGTGSLTNIGVGTLALNSMNLYSGNTKANAGTIALSHPLALMNSPIDTTGSTGVFAFSGITAPTIGGLANSGTPRDLASVFTTGYSSVTNLILNPSGTVTYGGVIAADYTGTITMAGSGAQVLQGVNTYTGATILNAGTLEMSGSGSILNSAITLCGGGLKLSNTAAETGFGRVADAKTITANSGTITYNNTSGANVYAETIGSVALTSGQLNILEAVNQSGSGSQTLTLNGLTQSNTSAITLSSASGLNTTKNMIKVTGASPTSTGQIIGPWATVGTAANAQTDYAIYNGSEQVVSAAIATSVESTWANTTESYTRNAGLGLTTLTATRNVKALRLIASANSYVVDDYNNNYTLTSHPFVDGDAVVFSGATAPGNMTFGTIYYVVSAAANNFKVSTTPGGGALDLSNGAGTYVNVTGVVLLSTGNNLGTLGILNGAASTMAIAATGTGAVTLPSTTSDNLYVNAGSGAITLAAPIKNNTGALTLVKNGSGTLTLSSASSDYSGGTVINAGAVTISANNNLGAAGSALTFNGSGALTMTAAMTFDHPVALNNNAVMSLDATGSPTFSGAITGNGSINWVNGTATPSLSSPNNTFTGNLTLPTVNGSLFLGFASIGDGGLISFRKSSYRANVAYTGSQDLVLNNRRIDLTSSFGGVGDGMGGPINMFENNGTGIVIFNTDMTVASGRTGTFFFGGSNTGNNTFAGLIPDSLGGTLSIAKYGTGKWLLTNDNMFGGKAITGGGILSVAKIANMGVAQPLGVGSIIQLGYQGGSGNLEFTGSSTSTTDKQVQIGETGGNQGGAGGIINNGTGALAFSAATFNSALTGTTVSRTLTLGGNNTGANTIHGIITNNAAGGLVVLTKTGVGTWVLSGANTYTGTTTVNGGKLTLKNPASGLTQTLGALVLAGPDVTLESDYNSGSGNLYTTFGSLTARSAGNTANILYTGGTVGTDNKIMLTQAAGFIDKGVFCNGASYAAMNALNTYVRAMNYDGVDANTVAADTITASKHVKLTTPPANRSTITLLSLNLSAGGVNWTQNASQTLTCPAILKAGGGSSTISGGSAVTGGAELVIRTDTPSDSLAINTPVTGAFALTKSGAGTLTLSGTNTYTGITYVNQGTLRLANATATGTTAGGITVQPGAAVELAGGLTIGAEAINSVIGTGVANGGALRNESGTNTYAGAITLGTGGALINSASGRLTLGGAITTALGNDLYFGGAGDVMVTNVISGVGRLIKDGTGSLTLTANNTYSGATLINEGTMIGVVGGSCSNSAVTVASAGTLAVSVIDNTKQWTCSSLTLNTGSHLKFICSVNPGATAPLNIKGDLTFSGSPEIVIEPRLDPGTYRLLTVGGTAPTSQSLPTLSGVTGKLTWIDKTLWLTVIPNGTFIQIF